MMSLDQPVIRGASSAREIDPLSPANGRVAVSPAHGRLARARDGARPGGEAGQAMNGQFVLHALRRWWKAAFLIGLLLATIATAAVYWLFEPQYEAASLLEISERPQYIAFEPREAGASQAYFRTQIELIRSRWILGRALDNEKIRQFPEIRKESNPIQWLKKRVSVVSANESGVFEIKYASSNPENAALVVNEITKQYLAAQEEEESQRNHVIVAALTEEMKSREKAVGTLRAQVRAATKQISGKEPDLVRPDPSSPAKNPLGELQARLVAVQVERAMLNARIKAGEEELRSAERADAAPNGARTKTAEAPLSQQELELRDAMVARAIAESADVKQWELLLTAKRAKLPQIEGLLRRGKEDPAYINRQEEIAREQQSLDEVKQKMVAPIQREVELSLRSKRTDSQVATLARRREEVARMRLDLRGYELAEENLRTAYSSQMKKLSTELEQVGGENANLTFMKDELAQAEKVLERIAERQIALQTERGAPSRVIWHEPAHAPNAPVEVLPYKKLALAVLACLCLPFGLAVGWESLVRRIGGSEDLEQQLQLAVLGEITRLPRRSHNALVSAEAGTGLELRVFQESVDSLRTALTLSDDLRDMRILAITSAAAQEGKTSVASQLALSLARATGKMTLLIDGDMRSPDLHNVFDIPQEPGLAEVLSDQCPLADGIVKTHNEHVHLLPAGELKGSPHRLLANGSWESLLEQIQTTYRYVIIDTPPVLTASEALVLAKAADATLICVMRDVSRADHVRKASERLLSAGGHPIGTVLSGVPTHRYNKYGYGTYPSS
ncbi:MAG: polysaccharide biosynthesis tyrosine autokinase [Thermoguttaceae bacterium]